MRVDVMRLPHYSSFFSDPPFGEDIFQRPRRGFDTAVREVPIQFDPFPSLHAHRTERVTESGPLFSDIDADIPEDFWEPVPVPTSSKRYKLKNDQQKKNGLESFFLDLPDEEDDEFSDANNSGVSIKSRRKSLSKLRRSLASKAEEFCAESAESTCVKTPKHGTSHKTDKEQEKDCEFKSTLDTCERKPECIQVDSLEEAREYQDLCDFFGCDGSTVQPEKSARNSSVTYSDIRPTPNYPAYDIIRKILRKDNRCVDYIEGDGNCFFRSLSKIIYGSESCHSELRQAVVDLLEKFPREFEQFIDGSMHEHIKDMRKLGTWATQTEIYVAATLLQRDVYVLSPDHTGEVYRWLLFSPQFSYKEASLYDPCYLTLCHTNGNHYDRIASVDRKCNCGALPPQMMGIQGAVDLTDEVV